MAAERMQRIPSRLREWIERAKTGLLQRYQRLQPREQRLLQAAALLLPVLAVVFGMALPLHDRLARLRADIGALAIQAGDANALADQLRARGGKAPERR